MNDRKTSDIEFFPITVKQCGWQASKPLLKNIRRQVFIAEQGVPEAEEFSVEDDDASHWIAYGANDVAMGTVRLLGDKIGRMAVLKNYRQRGVGSALLRQIIHCALTTGHSRLQLDAQLHAISFYQKMKFKTDGQPFDDVGIAHQHMSLNLAHFSNPRVPPTPAAIHPEERRPISLNDIAGFRHQAHLLAQQAQRKIRISSPTLDPNIFDNDTLRSHLFNFASQHPSTEIHILVQHPQPLVQNSHRLLQLYHRLPSHVQIRTLKPPCQAVQTEFMLIDQSGILYKQSLQRYSGYAVSWSPLEATELANNFDSLWNVSEADPELRKLPL